jgi:murein DD-endopeptidase MepM/ murein hydrolase activator NlpD
MQIRSFTFTESVMMSIFCVAIILGAILVLNRSPLPGAGRAPINASREPASPTGPIASSRASGNPGATAVLSKGRVLPSDTKVDGADIERIKSKNLLIPVAGVRANQLHDSFGDQRSEGRQHQALDIPAASGTPVLATTEGRIVKLFHSDKGGITLYELDPSGLYVYYYAHLSGYAPGISEGAQVSQGATIAYVGDTGNAGQGNFHLHFAISKLGPGDRWSGGTPVNPYPILAGK